MIKYGFFFLTDEHKAPRVTVCMKLHEFVSIGTAICGIKETPEVRFGMITAMRRADRMSKYGTTTIGKKLIVNEDALAALVRCGYYPRTMIEWQIPCDTKPWVRVKGLNLNTSRIGGLFPPEFKATLGKMQAHNYEYCACLDKTSVYSKEYDKLVDDVVKNFFPVAQALTCKVEVTWIEDTPPLPETLVSLQLRVQELEQDIKTAIAAASRIKL